MTTDFAAKSKSFTARISGDFPLRDGRNFAHAFRFLANADPADGRPESVFLGCKQMLSARSTSQEKAPRTLKGVAGLILFSSAPDRTRTCDLMLRRQQP